MPRSLALLLLAPSLASAQPTVTFEQALALSDASPAAEAPRRELATREPLDDGIGGTAQATNVTLMPGLGLGADQAAGLDAQAAVTQSWNLADLGGVRRRAAREERQALGARARADALRVRLEAARRWIDLATFQEVAATLEAQREVLAARLERTERARAAGVASALDVAAARAALAELEQRRLDVEGDRVGAANQLAVAMGRPPERGLRAEGPLPSPALPRRAAIEARLARFEALPEVVASRLASLAARAREAEASAAYAPVLAVGAQLERSVADTWVVYGIASLTFNAFGEERRAVSRSAAEADRAEVELDAARVRARAEVEDALHDLEHGWRRLRGLEAELLPALDALVASSERALAAGEETVFAVHDARRRQLDVLEVAARARGALSWARVRLWLMLAELARGADA
ncbi:MAG: TolC family protein [Sandaracinaceae bacterium]|nr:TolC family protein [Sandaracinaceae bacterium]